MSPILQASGFPPGRLRHPPSTGSGCAPLSLHSLWAVAPAVDTEPLPLDCGQLEGRSTWLFAVTSTGCKWCLTLTVFKWMNIFLCCFSSISSSSRYCSSLKSYENFPGGLVVKNLPCKVGDTGSIPGLGRSHMLRGSWAHVSQLLDPVCLEPMLCNKKSCRKEKAAYCNQRGAPTCCN